jgi:hypothetical protein
MIHECTQVSPTVASCDWLRRAMLKLVMLEFWQWALIMHTIALNMYSIVNSKES